MRILSWILVGIGAGVFAGFVTGLLKRRPTHPESRVPSYAGGYYPPTPSTDHTAVHPQAVATPHT
jgi:hypothetical protein